MDERRVACPRCHVVTGEPCKSVQKGNRIKGSHPERHRAVDYPVSRSAGYYQVSAATDPMTVDTIAGEVMVCEQHPWLTWPHTILGQIPGNPVQHDCAGPGMPLSSIMEDILVARQVRQLFPSFHTGMTTEEAEASGEAAAARRHSA
jgi:hypothetical protein